MTDSENPNPIRLRLRQTSDIGTAMLPVSSSDRLDGPLQLADRLTACRRLMLRQRLAGWQGQGEFGDDVARADTSCSGTGPGRIGCTHVNSSKSVDERERLRRTPMAQMLMSNIFQFPRTQAPRSPNSISHGRCVVRSGSGGRGSNG